MVAAVASAVALACTPQPGAGSVAYVAAGALRTLDLGTCARRTLVPRGASTPLAFSHDGRWIAFGAGKVVPTSGGKVLRPVGSVWRWAWSPTKNVLAGLTVPGGVVVGGPGSMARVRAPAGWGANSFAWSPDGRSLAVGRGKFDGLATPKGIQQLVVFGEHGWRVVYTTPRGQVAPPDVVAWIGTRIFFQPDFANSSSIAADGLALVALEGGRTQTVVQAMLPSFPIVPCGSRALIVAGGDRNTETNKRIVAFDGRTVRALTPKGLVWVEPACGPSIAAAAGPNRPVEGLIQPQRSIWLLAPLRRLTHSPKGWSDDTPTWTRDGKAIVFLRQRFGRGSLYIVGASTKRLAGPLATSVGGFAVSR